MQTIQKGTLSKLALSKLMKMDDADLTKHMSKIACLAKKKYDSSCVIPKSTSIYGLEDYDVKNNDLLEIKVVRTGQIFYTKKDIISGKAYFKPESVFEDVPYHLRGYLDFQNYISWLVKEKIFALRAIEKKLLTADSVERKEIYENEYAPAVKNILDDTKIVERQWIVFLPNGEPKKQNNC